MPEPLIKIGDEIELLDGSKVRVIAYPMPTITLRTKTGAAIVRRLDDPSQPPEPNRLLLSNGKELLLTTDTDLSGAYVVMKMGTQIGCPRLKKMQVDVLDDCRPLMMAWLNRDGSLN